MLVVTLILGGCASGNVNDQRAVETQEATRGAVLEEIQATEFASRFSPGTPDSAPTWTPSASLSELVLASSVNSDGSPQSEQRSVSAGSTVYACARVSEFSPGQTVIAVWKTIDGGEIDRSEQELRSGFSQPWVALRWQSSGVASGTYAVWIYIDRVDLEHLMDSLVFQVY